MLSIADNTELVETEVFDGYFYILYTVNSAYNDITFARKNVVITSVSL